MGMTKFASKNADYGRVLGVLEGWVNSLEPMPGSVVTRDGTEGTESDFVDSSGRDQ